MLVYSLHNRGDRLQLWDEIRTLKEYLSSPLLIIGDFNEVLSIEERKGGLICHSSMEDFAALVQDLNVIDVPLVGRKYTWVRGKSCSKLDRMLVEHAWLEEFPDLTLWALERLVFDHCPLFLETERID